MTSSFEDPAAARMPSDQSASGVGDRDGLRDELRRSERERQQLRDELDRCQAREAELRNELDRAIQAREHLNDQLLHPQPMEAAGTLAAGLAHDMNNVLAAIMNFAELILDEHLESRVRADLEQILAEAERGAAFTRSLLAFSRKGQYRKQILEIDETLRHAVPLLAHTMPRSIEIRTELGAGAVRIEGDPVQLVQMLVNFALNAADAMAGAGVLSLTSDVVELDAPSAAALDLLAGRHARLRVSDRGSGMDDATRQRIFEPFFTTKPLGKGTGLGLSLVWGVVKGHKGAVSVTSRVGQGTTFSVHLPVTELPLPPAGATAERSHGPPAHATILVVDDEPAVRAGTRRILERVGYTVLTAADGSDALRVFAAHQATIGLVVLDVAMPVMDGITCFRQLRKISAVPVLVATGYAIDEQLQDLVASGVTLIEKPFASTTLVAEVTRLLQHRTTALCAPTSATIK